MQTVQRKKLYLIHLFLICLMTAIWANPLYAQQVITDLSNKEVPVEWNFTGAKILLYGIVEDDPTLPGKADVIVVVRGPNKKVSARQKKRIAGIWINSSAQKYTDVPAYYSVVSSQPLAKIAEAAKLESLGIGFQALVTRLAQVRGKSNLEGHTDPYSQAVIRIMRSENLYSEDPSGVTVKGNKLFSTYITLPANVPIGEFHADVYVFKHGQLLNITSQTLNIQKQGFERFVYSMAYSYPFFYGVMAVLLAVISGLIATAIFQRD